MLPSESSASVDVASVVDDEGVGILLGIHLGLSPPRTDVDNRPLMVRCDVTERIFKETNASTKTTPLALNILLHMTDGRHLMVN